jgi:fumarylacetoacetate (FAA) hydrolase
LNDGSRDGQLVVVSRDLSQAHAAQAIAGTLQQVLDDWNFHAPQLEDLYTTLNHGKARHAFAFDSRQCMAPLPRAYRWVDGGAYPSTIQGTGPTPRMSLGGSDEFLGPCDPPQFSAADSDIDFGAGLAVVTGDVAKGADANAALDSVRLLMLVNHWSLRQRRSAELALGLGALQGQPATAFGPVAVTPDELGTAWRGGRVHLTLTCRLNGQRFGDCDAASDMDFHFGQIVAHVAATRRLRAGSILGGGTVGNRDAARGFSCIAERRAFEASAAGEPSSVFMRHGDRIEIEMLGADGMNLFGTLDQRVAAAGAEDSEPGAAA